MQLQGVRADLQAQERTPKLLALDHGGPKSPSSSGLSVFNRNKLEISAAAETPCLLFPPSQPGAGAGSGRETHGFAAAIRIA